MTELEEGGSLPLILEDEEAAAFAGYHCEEEG